MQNAKCIPIKLCRWLILLLYLLLLNSKPQCSPVDYDATWNCIQMEWLIPRFKFTPENVACIYRKLLLLFVYISLSNCVLDDKTRSNFNCASSKYLRFGVVKEKENKNASEFQVVAWHIVSAWFSSKQHTRVGDTLNDYYYCCYYFYRFLFQIVMRCDICRQIGKSTFKWIKVAGDNIDVPLNSIYSLNFIIILHLTIR